MLRDAYLVVHVYKVASLRDLETNKKSKATLYRRPYGCAVQPINSVLMGSEDFESEVALKVCQ